MNALYYGDCLTIMRDLPAGGVEVLGNRYPRLQILSVEELLRGERFRTPSPAARGSSQQNMPLEI